MNCLDLQREDMGALSQGEKLQDDYSSGDAVESESMDVDIVDSEEVGICFSLFSCPLYITLYICLSFSYVT